jgi:fucose permease
MGNLGGALLPLLYGRLADRMDPTVAYAIVIPCYVFVLYYAVAGHRIGKQLQRTVEVA